jgi:hypothetical protein
LNFANLERSMPSSSPKQVRTMAAAAHDPKFAKQMGIPQKVAKDFNVADQRRRQGQIATALRGKRGSGGQI